MHRYIPNTDADAKAMLDVIGIKSMDQLFQGIPDDLILKRALKLASGISKLQI